MARIFKAAVLLYPFLVWALLALGNAPLKRILCAAVLIASIAFCAWKFFREKRSRGVRAIFPPLVLSALLAAVLLTGNDDFFRLYPIVVSGLFLFQFSRSLAFPPTVVERIARISDKDFSDDAIPYARKVTIVWCVFFVFNIAVSAGTAFAPWEIWVLYNGLISYVLMGFLFAGEWLVRKRIKKKARERQDRSR